MSENPLHRACASGDMDMVEAFLHHSAESLHAYHVDVRAPHVPPAVFWF